jgi:hypothetical protein
VIGPQRSTFKRSTAITQLTLSLRYFTKDGQHGVCVFRRRKTTEPGHRGFRLSSLGILLAKSRRPRPFRHVKALKALVDTIYSSSCIQAWESGIREPTTENFDWEPARLFFEERKLRRADLGGAGDWAGWSAELDGVRSFITTHAVTLIEAAC